MSAVWCVRVPKGAAAAADLARGRARVDVGVREDVSGHRTLDEMVSEVRLARPDLTSGKAESRARNLLDLVLGVSAGDLVLAHAAGSDPVSGVCLGRTGRAEDGTPALLFRDPLKLPRSALGEDVLNSMRAHAALSVVGAPEAFFRISAARSEGKDPGPDPSLGGARAVGARMGAHELAELIADLLATDGYRCRVAPPGPDGGVDIRAGKGLLGLGDSLLVQVKSGRQVVGAPHVYQILGNLADCGAKATLIVSWSGFTTDARRVIEKNPFKIVAWSFDDILEALTSAGANVPDKWHKKFNIG